MQLGQILSPVSVGPYLRIMNLSSCLNVTSKLVLHFCLVSRPFIKPVPTIAINMRHSRWLNMWHRYHVPAMRMNSFINWYVFTRYPYISPQDYLHNGPIIIEQCSEVAYDYACISPTLINHFQQSIILGIDLQAVIQFASRSVRIGKYVNFCY